MSRRSMHRSEDGDEPTAPDLNRSLTHLWTDRPWWVQFVAVLSVFGIVVTIYGVVADRVEYAASTSTQADPQATVFVTSDPEDTNETNAISGKIATDLSEVANGSCLEQDIPLRLGKFIPNLDGAIVVDCTQEHHFEVAYDNFFNCDDQMFSSIVAPKYLNRVISESVETDSTDLCVFGVNENGSPQTMNASFDDLATDSRWLASEIGSCSAPETEDLIAAANAPVRCQQGSLLLYKTEVSNSYAGDNSALAGITDQTCGALASDIGATRWKAKWLGATVVNTVPYWCGVYLD